MGRTKLTAGRIAELKCPEGKGQVFLWDSTYPGLGLRATAGSKSYVFQSVFQSRTLRMTIGSTDVWSIPEAGKEARRLQRTIDEGRDPRQVKAELTAADVAKRTAERRDVLTVADVWPQYMAEGKPRKKDAWKPRYVADLIKAASLGGEPKKRGEGVTKPGHLAALMPLRLASIDRDVIRDWYKEERKRGPVQAARSVAMFSGFLSWCGNQKAFRDYVDRECARASGLSDLLPGARRRTDALERDQLEGWFAATERLMSPIMAVYLQGLLLTGARREELATLKWEDVDFRWKRLEIADKVDKTRIIPLAPYIESRLSRLPRVVDNPYVFARPTSRSGRVSEPRSPHERVLAEAGIPHVSIHGLRRSFSLMGEASGAPAGAIAQIMGHRPSGVAEGYRPRSLDDLRTYLTNIETYILKNAGVDIAPAIAFGGLSVVTAA